MVAALLLELAPSLSPSGGVQAAADCRHLSSAPALAAVPNDNRVRAGTLRDGVLTVRLVARAVAWRPDGPDGCALPVHAFAEEGKATQVPGPLIRVAAGTEVRATVRNALPAAIWVRGLQDRALGMRLDSAEVAPGATREFRFVATTPGAWYYWAGVAATRVPRSQADGQLAGALVVDSAPRPGAAPREDRVLVLTRWTPTGTGEDGGFQVNAFNGRSWPHTERLTYTVGDSVRWHVINASDGIHEMHLHGFFFRTDATGFAIDTAPPPGMNMMRVTRALRPGEWLSMTWSPDRPGKWLYHCHLLAHMSGAQRLDRMPAASGGAAATASTHRHEGTDASHAHEMAGLVLGLEVKPAPRARAITVASVSTPERVLDLYAGARPRTFGDLPGYGFVLREGPRAPAADSIRIPGSPLVLTRGEPARITVHNRLAFPIAVHWHGLELESFYDGVGGFSGAGRRVAPMIAPNDSFVVRLTPPRAGTYMYHVHGERGEELASGLYGPLVVVAPGTPYDPRTDRTLVVADGGPGETPPVFVNGTAAPDTLALVAGTTYRLRLSVITANDVVRITLRRPGGPVPARLIAFDGHDVPGVPPEAPQGRPQGANTGPGHTLDLAFTPATPGDHALVFERLAKGARAGMTAGQPTTVPIRVRAP